MLLFVTFLAFAGATYAQHPSGNPKVFDYTSCYCWRYEVFCKTEDSDWQWAKDECESMGGWLATIDKKTTHQEIRKLIRAQADSRVCNNYGFWIGLHDASDPKTSRHQGQPEKFSWVHEQCHDFQVWESNQPNDNNKKDSNGQNCVQLWHRPGKKGNYDDEYCGKTKGYICQFEEECPCINQAVE
ncbi:C-type lectin lectoxin-Thr1-like [Saccoglossus kowalevskii]|uniref:Uncharacterized protein LOC102808762 n=1 Tax=Saccoglossus kowalevskii TaxID=10224 RepID=A0ABM0MIM5_SACKO|nr:PREDICTED: uncharacterized protein LOC102808762 [Saccoglossus kowalevskii]